MRFFLGVSALGFVLAACGVDASREAVGLQQQAIVNGSADTTDSAVVMVLVKKTRFPNPFEWCSGVVVSPHVVVTAAHCIDPAEIEPGATLSIYVGDSYLYGEPDPPASALFGIRETHMVSNFSLATVPTQGRDFGVVITNDALPGAPVAMNRGALDASIVGQSVRVVGFGNSVPSNNNSAGTRHQVELPITEVNDKFIVERYDDASTCGGDSGGATFLTKEGHDVLVGIHAATVGTAPCTGPNYDTRIISMPRPSSIRLSRSSIRSPMPTPTPAPTRRPATGAVNSANAAPSSGCSTTGTRSAGGGVVGLVAGALAAALLRKRAHAARGLRHRR